MERHSIRSLINQSKMKTKEELASEYSKSQHKYMLDKRVRQVIYAIDQAINISESDFKAGYNACLENITSEQLLPIIEKVFGPGCAAICKERKRQIEVESWTPENDDQYDGGELAKASASYILPEESRSMVQCAWRKIVPLFFPRWNIDWWKPTPNNRSRELEKGIALGMAEIDRLERKEESK